MTLWRKWKNKIEARRREPAREKAVEKEQLLEERLSELAGKTQIAPLLAETADLFEDITDQMVPYRQDGISGNACYCNYLRLKDGVPVTEAVEKYIAVLELLNLLVKESTGELSRSKLVLFHGHCLMEDPNKEHLKSWYWDETFFYAVKSNLPASEKELEPLLERCRMNRIHIICNSLSLTENKTFHIDSGEYWGSVDDAATYVSYTLRWGDPVG